MVEILVAAIANLLTRFLPILFFKKHYKRFLFLKEEFPTVLLTILTLYVLFPKELDLKVLSFKLIAIGLTLVVHLLFRRFLLSIFLGSLLYIVMVNGLI